MSFPHVPPHNDRRCEAPSYKLFEKFYSLQRPHTGKKGTGLGLALVQQIAALHQGRAALANDPAGGAVATLALPRLP